MNARPQQIIATLTLALALSAVLIGSAQAADRPDNRAGIHGLSSQNADVSDVFSRAVVRALSVQTVRPDNRAGLRGVGTTPTATPAALTDVFERAVLRHNASTPPRPDDRAGLRGAGTAIADSAPIATTASAGFQWADAGSGAAATLALILILGGLVRTRNHRRRVILD
jgi:hypothetical protein